MTPEQEASQKIRERASEMGCRLLRNNNGACYNDSGRFIRFGLGNESEQLAKNMAMGDFIGFYNLTITPEMVGKEVAVFSMIECKPMGKLPATLRRATNVKDSREAAQFRAIEFVRKYGGIAWFASCADDVTAIINNFLDGLKR